MKTRYGVCPSFASWALGRLPLFADPMRRGVAFEVFRADGTPTAELSPLDPDGWPARDDRWHGVRLFGDMGGTMPKVTSTGSATWQLRAKPGESAFLSWKGGGLPPIEARFWRVTPSYKGWHLPSLDALKWFDPVCLRTLDWGWQARKEKRSDWTRPRVLPTDPLHGAEMAVELQAEAANLLNVPLWWNAPPRFELTVAEYETRLEELLRAIKSIARHAPWLELGNELWNDGFPVRNWLDTQPGSTWHNAAAAEIRILKRVADRVFGSGGPLGQRPYYLFVGGHIGVPETLDRILRALDFTPDMVGPAVYAQPLQADRERWDTATELSQTELRDSVMANMTRFQTRLREHALIATAHKVPYLACYEVGQDMHARGDVYKQAALQAQHEKWMGGVYRQLRTTLSEAGVSVACWYSAASSQSLERSFGLLESCDLTNTMPKARAVRGELS